MKLFTLMAELQLSTLGFDTEVKHATDSGQSLAQRLGADADSIKAAFDNAFSFSVGQLMADAVQSAMTQLVEFTSESIKAASDLEQTNQKIDAIFGDMSAAVMAWSATTKSEFGIGQLAAKTYAAQLAGILSTDAYDLDAAQIYEYSTAMVELAGDLASFHNMDVDTIWTKLLSGLRGETEAIEDLGLDMRVASLAAFAGIDEKDFSKLPTVEQWLYRYQYILQNTTVAQGDFARTSDSYANQMALFEQNIKDLQGTIGDGLLPVLTDLLSFANGLFAFFETAETPTEAVEGITTEFASAWAEIETTTTKALALVDALAQLEEGGLTEEEQTQWDALVQRLVKDVPGIAAAISSSTGEIAAGSEAMREYIEQAKAMQIEVAQLNAMESYNAKLGALQVQTAEKKTAADEARIDAESLTALYNQTMQDAFDYIYKAHGQEAPSAEYRAEFLATDEAGNWLNEALWTLVYEKEDAGAKAYAQLIASLTSPEEAEKQAVQAEQEYQSSLQELRELEGQITALMAAIETLAGKEQTVVVNVSTTLDGDEIATAVESKISTDAANKALVSGE